MAERALEKEDIETNFSYFIILTQEDQSGAHVQFFFLNLFSNYRI